MDIFGRSDSLAMEKGQEGHPKGKMKGSLDALRRYLVLRILKQFLLSRYWDSRTDNLETVKGSLFMTSLHRLAVGAGDCGSDYVLPGCVHNSQITYK